LKLSLAEQDLDATFLLTIFGEKKDMAISKLKPMPLKRAAGGWCSQ